MGCINSKNAVAGDSPARPKARADNGPAIVEPPPRSRSETLASAGKGDRKSEDSNGDGKKSSGKENSNGSGNIISAKMGPSHRFVEAELNAAGWPPWLTAAAGEAIHGWVPLRANSFEKLEKARRLILIFVIS